MHTNIYTSVSIPVGMYVCTQMTAHIQEALDDILLESSTKRIKWDRLLGLITSIGSSKAKAETSGDGSDPRPGSDSDANEEELVRGLIEFLLSDSGRRYVDAIAEDVVDLADNLQVCVCLWFVRAQCTHFACMHTHMHAHHAYVELLDIVLALSSCRNVS